MVINDILDKIILCIIFYPRVIGWCVCNDDDIARGFGDDMSIDNDSYDRHKENDIFFRVINTKHMI